MVLTQYVLKIINLFRLILDYFLSDKLIVYNKYEYCCKFHLSLKKKRLITIENILSLIFFIA